MLSGVQKIRTLESQKRQHTSFQPEFAFGVGLRDMLKCTEEQDDINKGKRDTNRGLISDNLHFQLAPAHC